MQTAASEAMKPYTSIEPAHDVSCRLSLCRRPQGTLQRTNGRHGDACFLRKSLAHELPQTLYGLALPRRSSGHSPYALEFTDLREAIPPLPCTLLLVSQLLKETSLLPRAYRARALDPWQHIPVAVHLVDVSVLDVPPILLRFRVTVATQGDMR